MEIYVIRSRDPLDHEGSPDVVSVFVDKSLADEAVKLLQDDEKETRMKIFGDRWWNFACEFEVETWTVDNDPMAVLAERQKNR